MQNLVTQFFSVDHERLDFLFRMYRENKKNQRYKAVLLFDKFSDCLLYTSPSPRDQEASRMPSSA